MRAASGAPGRAPTRVAGASSQLALVSSSRRELRDRLPGGVAVEPADVRLVGDGDGPIEPQDVRPVVRALDHRGHAVAREPIDDLDHIARGGCGWGDGILAHVWLYRRVRPRVEHFFRSSVRIPADGDADARSRLCDGDRKRRRPAAGGARRPARPGRYRRARASTPSPPSSAPRAFQRRCRRYRCFAGIRRGRGARRSAASTTSGRTSASRSAARSSRPARRTSIAHSRSTCARTRSCAAPRCRICAPRAAARSASPPPTPRCSRSPSSRPYAVTKAAALALARQVARDYSGEGIRVNALCPGWIDTPFNTPAWENFGGRERFLAEVPRLVPLGRIGTPEEAGKLACFLLSDDAAYMTGHALVADGGECLPG